MPGREGEDCCLLPLRAGRQAARSRSSSGRSVALVPQLMGGSVSPEQPGRLPGAARLPQSFLGSIPSFFCPASPHWGEATAKSTESGQKGMPGTEPPEGKQQGLADAIHRRREDIFHLGFITEMSSRS